MPPEDRAADARAVLRQGGEVGRDLLAVDWAATPLGPPETWSQSLTTIVHVLLTSRFSMWMAWGPELTFFCNAAYRRDTLGTKYPWALGRPAREVWAEIWPDIGPRIQAVTTTGAATWDEALLLFLERSGYAEETYHTFSYSPLTDDDGAIAGMLCVVSEETERVVGARRMATLRDLGSGLTTARSEADVLDAAAQHLGANSRSLPFTLIYVFDADGARLAGATGIPTEHPAAPAQLPADATAPWPVARLLAGREAVVDLSGMPDLPTGAWDEPPVQALVVPLPQLGQRRPYGFLVAALNRYRPLDDGHAGFVRLVASQLAASFGTALAYQTERERAETLAELDRAKTAFFTNVSHELRTPLTLLLGPAEDAIADPAAPLPEPQRRRVEVILRNGQRLLKLVNTLLDFSRLEADRLTARFEPIDLPRYTSELASMFDSAVERAGLELVIDCPPLPEPVHVDREMWAKIVLNLVSNALKFTFEGGITVRVDAEDGQARLTVSDTGIGIAPEEQARLFERFHRVVGARSRTYEGSGIGLALVAELAGVHGGDTAVQSALGEGSRFVVRVPFGDGHLPAEQVSAAADVADDAQRHAEGFIAEAMRWLEPGSDGAAAAAGPDDRPRVLIADDNADMRDYVSALLSDRYRVETAADGAIALEKARARTPDLVITDVMMPNLDGLGLLAALHAEPSTTGIPVIMLSARAGEEGMLAGLEAGADDYLVKPFSARELLARVRANLELDRVRRTRDELHRSQGLLNQAQRLARVGSWELDLATGAITGSEELARQLQMSEAELRERGPEALIERVHPEDFERARAALDSAMAGDPLDVELRLRTPDGAERVYRTMGELERDDAGRPVRLRGSSQDVTEQRAAERAVTAAAAEREAARRERRIADELQRSLLPARDFAPEHLEVAAFYQAGVAGTQVGGDWYDVIELGAGRTALVLGDVMGRGVQAAAIMGQLSAAVRAYARLDLPPADVLEFLDGVVRDLDHDQIVTCIYAVFDPRDRTLTYANAGQLPPVLVSSGGPVRRLAAPAGPPLGSGPFVLEERRESLGVGDKLVLYTDGLVERRDRSIDTGIDALVGALSADGAAVAELPGRLVEALVPEGGDDDIAVLVACVPDAVQDATAALALAAEPGEVPRARAFLAAELDGWDVEPALRSDAVLIVSELVTNAIMHGRPPVELRVRCTPDHVLLEVDDGATALPRRQRPTPDDEHGRGLQLTAMIADRWGTRPLRDGKSVWCLLARARYAAGAP